MFDVGDRVVYPHHGAAIVKKKEMRKAFGEKAEYLVLEMAHDQEKLKSGDVYQVAEVVRNLALREADKGLSAGEKSLYTKARNVLVSELSFALEISEDDATERVEGALIP